MSAPSSIESGPVLDHLLLASRDLDAGVAAAARALGARPAQGGSHPTLGTRNALLGLGPGRYLEVIGLDPGSGSRSAWADAVAAFERPGLLTYCMRAPDIDALAAAAAAAGVGRGQPVDGSRARPDGAVLRWRMLMLEGHPFGPALPFFIDWGETEHPADALEDGGLRLASLRVRHPAAASLRRAYDAPGIGVAVDAAPEPGLVAEIATRAGSVILR